MQLQEQYFDDSIILVLYKYTCYVAVKSLKID